MSNDKDSKLPKTIDEGLARLEERIGQHRGRISTMAELLALKGEKIWLVSSPIDHNSGNEPECTGSSFLISWTVGEIFDSKGKIVADSKEFPKGKNIPKMSYFNNDSVRTWDEDGETKHLIISLRDYNVIPNHYTNHAAFTTENDANNYRMWLKMRYPLQKQLELLDRRCINGNQVNLDKTFKEGVQYRNKLTED
jgi:hypothetical protein